MRMLAVDARSDEWHRARLGLPTASQLHRIVTPGKLALSESSFGYLCELVAERILGRDVTNEQTVFMERGSGLEDEAVSYYELQSGEESRPGGFCTTDDGLVGCSPDRLVGDEGGLEIKCPNAANHVGHLLEGLGKKYRIQVQGSLWVTRLKWWDVLSYNPELPPALERCWPDPEVFEALDRVMPEFLGRLEDAVAKLVKDGPRGLVDHPASEARVSNLAGKTVAGDVVQTESAAAVPETADVSPSLVEVAADQDYKALCLARMKSVGWKTATTQRQCVNTILGDLGRKPVKSASELSPDDWRAVWRNLIAEPGAPSAALRRAHDPEPAEPEPPAIAAAEPEPMDLAAFLELARARSIDLGREFVRDTTEGEKTYHWFMDPRILQHCGLPPDRGLNLARVGVPVLTALADEIRKAEE